MRKCRSSVFGRDGDVVGRNGGNFMTVVTGGDGDAATRVIQNESSTTRTGNTAAASALFFCWEKSSITLGLII